MPPHTPKPSPHPLVAILCSWCHHILPSPLHTPWSLYCVLGATTYSQTLSTPPGRYTVFLVPPHTPKPSPHLLVAILCSWCHHILPSPLHTSWSLYILCSRCHHILPSPLHTSWSLYCVLGATTYSQALSTHPGRYTVFLVPPHTPKPSPHLLVAILCSWCHHILPSPLHTYWSLYCVLGATTYSQALSTPPGRYTVFLVPLHTPKSSPHLLVAILCSRSHHILPSTLHTSWSLYCVLGATTHSQALSTTPGRYTVF